MHSSDNSTTRPGAPHKLLRLPPRLNTPKSRRHGLHLLSPAILQPFKSCDGRHIHPPAPAP